MAPKVKAVRSRSSKAGTSASTSADDPGEPPSPFKRPPEILAPFIASLTPSHIYITHVDLKPVSFKRNIFLVPLFMNLAVAALFVLRMYWIFPWYWELVRGSFGQRQPGDPPPFDPGSSSWQEIGWEVAKRGSTLMLDFALFMFIWPWPLEFAFGQTHGNPVRWRLKVGFREKEVYVRRSREWDRQLREGDTVKGGTGRKKRAEPIDFLDPGHTGRLNGLLALIRNATAPMLQHEKTGYLTMDGEWDLDWESMVQAHAMVDKKEIALDVFRSVVLVHHDRYGWMCLNTSAPGTDVAGGTGAAAAPGDAQEGGESVDDKRRKVFEFRDALSAIGKEDLFFRWIEMVQYEATRPDGFGPERQVEAAKKIRDLFQKEGIDFDKFWKDSVGSEAFVSG